MRTTELADNSLSSSNYRSTLPSIMAQATIREGSNEERSRRSSFYTKPTSKESRPSPYNSPRARRASPSPLVTPVTPPPPSPVRI
eukprot:5262603-Pleurochrysis_carterae.AAC.1